MKIFKAPLGVPVQFVQSAFQTGKPGGVFCFMLDRILEWFDDHESDVKLAASIIVIASYATCLIMILWHILNY